VSRRLFSGVYNRSVGSSGCLNAGTRKVANNGHLSLAECEGDHVQSQTWKIWIVTEDWMEMDYTAESLEARWGRQNCKSVLSKLSSCRESVAPTYDVKNSCVGFGKGKH
jgi:hypothetical protein